jgi:hypothetical protein
MTEIRLLRVLVFASIFIFISVSIMNVVELESLKKRMAQQEETRVRVEDFLNQYPKDILNISGMNAAALTKLQATTLAETQHQGASATADDPQ